MGRAGLLMLGNVCGEFGPPPELLGAEGTSPDDWPLCCMGAAVYGPRRCTCWQPVYDRRQVDPAPADLQVQRRMCHDCAYRPGSPEREEDGGWDELQYLTLGDNPFWCHQGMRRVIAWRHPDGRELPAADGDYAPGVLEDRPYRADGRPALICGGWAAVKAKMLELHEAAR